MLLVDSIQKKLERTLNEAIELAQLGRRGAFSAEKMAERIYDSEPELMAEISRPLVVQRLTWMIHRLRRGRWNLTEDMQQMVLPDPVFEGLPRRIFVRNGERPKLDDATLPQTNAHLKFLKDRFKNHWKVKQFEAVVELHRKWAAIQQNIKWGDAKRREAEYREKH